jgi:hypothetical protein
MSTGDVRILALAVVSDVDRIEMGKGVSGRALPLEGAALVIRA